MRALAVLPLIGAGRPIGLFAAYRRTPRNFTDNEVTVLKVYARGVAILALDRLSGAEALYGSPIGTAVGMLMERHRLDADGALALLRARAFTTDTTVPALASALVEGRTTIDE